MTDSRHSPGLAALILAAGYASRMGQFKPLLPLDGKTAIESAINTFRSTSVSTVMVVTGHNRMQLQTMLEKSGVSAVHNPDYASGMYSSVQAGIKALPEETEACFLLPADMPLVRAATIRAVAKHHASTQAPIIYPVFQGERGHPPLISHELFADILAGDSQGGLHTLLQRHEKNASEIEVVDEGILLDMDTPEDYARMRILAPHRQAPTLAECEAILEALGVAQSIRSHGQAVAAVAEAFTQRLAACGVAIDPSLVRAASLLHDIAKGRPAHAHVGASIVADLGFPQLACIIGRHMDMSFDGGEPREDAIVFLADKLVQQDRRVSLEERFQPAFERFHDQAQALRGANRKYNTAQAILGAVEQLAGVGVTDILANCGVPTCP
jgi:CTP:molybdopterin cytidylyltransferase MocA